jgi:TolB-like protein
MRLVLLPLAALLVMTGLPRASAAQEVADTRPGIAVFPFTNGGSFGPQREDLEPLQVGIQQMLLTELAQNPNLRIVERSRIREILDEQGLVTSGQVDPNTAARIGRLVGARYIITGAFMDLYGTFRLDGRVVDVETGEILRTQEVRDRKQNIYGLLVDLSARITEGVNLPPLEAPVARQRRARAIPPEAVTLYSRAQVFEDLGQQDRAIELYRQIAQSFPEMTEAREALRQLNAG